MNCTLWCVCVPEQDAECAALSLPLTLETDLLPDLEPGSGQQALVVPLICPSLITGTTNMNHHIWLPVWILGA